MNFSADPRPDPVLVSSADPRPGETAFGAGYAALLMGLTALTFAAGVGLMWVFGYTFWAILEGMARAFGWGRGGSLIAPLLNALSRGALLWGGSEGWRLDAAVFLGVTATWTTLYFALDHIALLGNGRAQRILLRKASRLVREQGDVLPEMRAFVELRSTDKSRRMAPLITPDIGWLLFYPNRLRFIGEGQIITLPRSQIAAPPTLSRSPGNLTGASLALHLMPPHSALRLVARDAANALSATEPDARRLRAALTAWLARNKGENETG